MNEQQLRQLVADTINAWVGSTRGSAGHREILQIYNAHTPLARGYRVQQGDAYCATTVSATWIKCGIAGYTGTECSVGFLIAEAMRRGIWIERDDYVPKLGDAVCYFWKDNGKGDCTGWPDHIGIVTLPGPHQFTVTEGNMSGGRVWTRPMAVDGRYIRGFIAPNYAAIAAKLGGTYTPTPASIAPAQNNTKEVPNMKQIRKGSTGYQVKVAQLLLILNGCSCGSYGADGDFGVATDAAVRKFQQAKRLEIDGIVGPITWAALLGV